MAKKKQEAAEIDQRVSRKEILRQRKQEEQLRNVRIGIIVVVALVIAILAFAIINEYVLSPQRSVATVGSEEITLSEWQDRVRFERAQRLVGLEDQLELFNNDVGLIQQFSGQTINELVGQNAEAFGEGVLNQMTRDSIVRQALAERGESITEAEIDERIGAAFDYYGGASPTAVPDPTATPQVTPSVTPIGATAEEDAESVGPVAPEQPAESAPTATPVSEEAFQEEFDTLMDRYAAMGVSREDYRRFVAGALASERLLEVLADEQELPAEDLHASALLLIYGSEEEAQQALEEAAASDFLTVWNTQRSAPPAEEPSPTDPSASEILWQTSDSIAARQGPDVASAIFDTPVGEATEVIEISGADGTPRFVIAQVTGREMRPLSDSEFRQRQIELYSAFIDERVADVEIDEFWRTRVPSAPLLNPLYLQPPTPAPEAPQPQATP